MLLVCCLSDSEMVPVAPVTTGITYAVTFHTRCISIIRSLYFKILSSSFLIVFLSPGIATSIDKHFPFLIITDCVVLCCVVLCCVVLGCVVLCCVRLCCVVLGCVVLC